ncbi:MAG TPA: hypothetical protein VK524_14235 [Polyangiaceae bacterium]|nr:hypothetical protein [Polyangiaceae bacterium]
MVESSQAPRRIAELSSPHSSIEIERIPGKALVIRLTGHDVGDHANEPFTALDAALGAERPLLFIDARGSKGASLEVSNAWASWLRSRRERLGEIHMLTGSRFIQLTADFVRRFADLGEQMFIYTDPAAFDERLSR